MTRVGRRLIEDFLLPALDDKRYGDRLQWVDKGKFYFSIKWNHKNAAKWTFEDTVVFQDWDKLKGHYHPDTKGYYMQAKQRFRAALYKLNTVRKVCSQDKHIKVYQLVLGSEKRKTNDSPVHTGIPTSVIQYVTSKVNAEDYGTADNKVFENCSTTSSESSTHSNDASYDTCAVAQAETYSTIRMETPVVLYKRQTTEMHPEMKPIVMSMAQADTYSTIRTETPLVFCERRTEMHPEVKPIPISVAQAKTYSLIGTKTPIIFCERRTEVHPEMKPIPMVQCLEAVSVQCAEALPVQHTEALPVQHTEAIPVQDTEDIPVQDMEAIPVQHEEAITVQHLEPVSIRNLVTVPVQRHVPVQLPPTYQKCVTRRDLFSPEVSSNYHLSCRRLNIVTGPTCTLHGNTKSHQMKVELCSGRHKDEPMESNEEALNLSTKANYESDYIPVIAR